MSVDRGCVVYAGGKIQTKLRARYVVFLALSCRCHSSACSQVLVDFLVGHGYLTSEIEPGFLEINQRLHGRFDIERW
jgi:hypothetical protein